MHFEANNTRTVVESDNKEKCFLTVYNRNGDVICMISLNNGNTPTVNIMGKWDIVK